MCDENFSRMLVQFLASASVVGCQSRNCTLKGGIVIRIVINHWGTGSELNDFAITVAGLGLMILPQAER